MRMGEKGWEWRRGGRRGYGNRDDKEQYMHIVYRHRSTVLWVNHISPMPYTSSSWHLFFSYYPSTTLTLTLTLCLSLTFLLFLVWSSFISFLYLHASLACLDSVIFWYLLTCGVHSSHYILHFARSNVCLWVGRIQSVCVCVCLSGGGGRGEVVYEGVCFQDGVEGFIEALIQWLIQWLIQSIRL